MWTEIDGSLSVSPSAGYKFESPGASDHAGYFNIVGGDKPEAFFINSKDMHSFQWITALLTSYSRQLRAGTPVEEIIRDMKNTFQPGGSYVIPDGSGEEAHSVVHHLGILLERHVEINKRKNSNEN